MRVQTRKARDAGDVCLPHFKLGHYPAELLLDFRIIF